MYKMHKKEGGVSGKWKKTRGSLDETGKSLYDTVESGLMAASCQKHSFHIGCFILRGFHHISGANETQQRSTESFYPLQGLFFRKALL